MVKPLILILVVLVIGVGIGFKLGQKAPTVGDCVNSVLGK